MNKVVLIGRNVKDVELKQTSTGTPVAEFSIAVKRTFKSASGEYESDFFNCVAFKTTAELISKYVKKGDMVGVEGKLQTRNYTNKEGRKIYITEIIVEGVEFLSTKKNEVAVEVKAEAPKTNWEEVDPFADEGLPF